jgi:hypothetical protein
MHYMALQFTMGKPSKKQMRNHIGSHTKMMGDIRYLQKELRQPDAKESVQAVIKEVN